MMSRPGIPGRDSQFAWMCRPGGSDRERSAATRTDPTPAYAPARPPARGHRNRSPVGTHPRRSAEPLFRLVRDPRVLRAAEVYRVYARAVEQRVVPRHAARDERFRQRDLVAEPVERRLRVQVHDGERVVVQRPMRAAASGATSCSSRDAAGAGAVSTTCSALDTVGTDFDDVTCAITRDARHRRIRAGSRRGGARAARGAGSPSPRRNEHASGGAMVPPRRSSGNIMLRPTSNSRSTCRSDRPTTIC
jgi:hypothetical protein